MLLVAAVLPIACGSGGDAETTTISKAEFAAKAKAICSKGTRKIDAYYSAWSPKAARHADSEEFMNGVAERIVIPVRTREVRELRALGFPEGSEKKLEAFLAAMEEGIEKGRKDRRTLRGGGSYAFERAFEMAESVGLQACFLG